ncbi:hypothetical protein BH11PLA2_BH11PLA2_06500 [soil metagenome]
MPSVSSSRKYEIILTGGALFLAIGVGAFFLLEGPRQKPRPVVTWFEFTSPDRAFTMSFPHGEPVSGELLAVLSGKDNKVLMEKEAEIKKAGVVTKAWSSTHASSRYIAGYMQFPTRVAHLTTPAHLLKEFEKEHPVGSVVNGETCVECMQTSFAGKPAVRCVIEVGQGNFKAHQTAYVFAVIGRLYYVVYEGQLVTPEDPLVAEFFGKFKMN